MQLKQIVKKTALAVTVSSVFGCSQNTMLTGKTEKVPSPALSAVPLKEVSEPLPEPEGIAVEDSVPEEELSDENLIKSENLPDEPDLTSEQIEDLISKSEFGVKALQGNLNVSGKTLAGSAYNNSVYLNAKGFEDNQVYEIYIDSPKPVLAKMYKKKSVNKYTFDRMISSGVKYPFRGGAIDFSEIVITGFIPAQCPSDPISFNASIKKVEEVKTNPLKVSFQSQYLLQDNLGLVKRLNGKRNVNKLFDLQDSACAVTSAAMLNDFNGRKKKSTINDESVYLYDIVGTDNISGTFSGNLVKVFNNDYKYNSKYYGWPNAGEYNTTTSRNNMWSTVVSEIDSGRPLIFRSHSIPGYGKHYILIIGYNKANNTVITNDPGSTKSGKSRVFKFSDISSKNAGVITVK